MPICTREIMILRESVECVWVDSAKNPLFRISQTSKRYSFGLDPGEMRPFRRPRINSRITHVLLYFPPRLRHLPAFHTGHGRHPHGCEGRCAVHKYCSSLGGQGAERCFKTCAALWRSGVARRRSWRGRRARGIRPPWAFCMRRTTSGPHRLGRPLLLVPAPRRGPRSMQ